jgi:hypothetical protein
MKWDDIRCSMRIALDDFEERVERGEVLKLPKTFGGPAPS